MKLYSAAEWKKKKKTPDAVNNCEAIDLLSGAFLSPAAFEHIWFKQPVFHSNRSEGYTVLRHYYHLMAAKGRKGK